jgi:hypothetical protein
MRLARYARPRHELKGRWSAIACGCATSPLNLPVIARGRSTKRSSPVAAILHDIGLYPRASRGGVYTADGAELAWEMLRAHSWSTERIRRCAEAIDRHHELRRQLARGGEVEALRLADLVDLSGGLLTFGLDRRWLRALNQTVPRQGLIAELTRELGRAFRQRPLTIPQIFWRP